MRVRDGGVGVELGEDYKGKFGVTSTRSDAIVGVGKVRAGVGRVY